MPVVIQKVANPSVRLGATAAAIEALMSGATELIERGTKGRVLDAAIIARVERIAHYQIATYSSAIAFARVLEYRSVAEFLSESLLEERHAAESLSGFAREEVNELASHSASNGS